MSHVDEIRYYKGKERVKVLVQSLGNWLVEALEPIGGPGDGQKFKCPTGHQFITVPRLLWRKPRGSYKPKPVVGYISLDVFLKEVKEIG